LRVPIKAISLELYNDVTKTLNDTVKVTQWITEEDVAGKTVLIVDEVDDTRTTLHFAVNMVKKMNAKSVGVFVVHNKLKNKRLGSDWISGVQQGCEAPLDYYECGQNIPDQWIVYPWDALNIEEHSSMGVKEVPV
jgi:hypoxanthine phosphoribosyltransferase